jgi:tRNA threonylcarbamoyladenosine modification (KEOPS) complex Cgi121 subunit
MLEAKILEKHLIIEGFKNIKIDNIDLLFGLIKGGSGRCHVQVLDAALVAGFEHIYFAVLNALKSFKTGLNISRSPAVEALLFASGQNQIKRAIEILGVKPSSSSVALIIIADDRAEAIATLNYVSNILGGERDQGVIELTDEKVPGIIEAFNISKLEMEASMRASLKDAVKNILIERAAILVTQR